MNIAGSRSANLPSILLAMTLGQFATASAEADVVISSKPTQNMNCVGGTCIPTSKNAVLNETDLAGMLSSGSVIVSSGALAKDIDVKAALTWMSTSRLTFDAFRSVMFDKPVIVAGTGALTITTDDGGAGGDFRFLRKGRVEFWDLTSSLVINGNAYGLVKNIAQLKRLASHSSFIALARNCDAGRHTYSKAPISTFAGTFEGLGNAISNLTINDQTSADEVALFGTLGGGFTDAEVRDVGLKSVNIVGSGGGQNVAALVAVLEGSTTNARSVANSFSTGTVTASGFNSAAGGLVGTSEVGSIARSYSSVTVSANNQAYAAGGLVAGLGADCTSGCVGTIDESYATGMVSGSDGVIVGGLAGFNHGASVSNSYATGAVSGAANALVGGLIGSNENASSENAFPVVAASYSTGAVSGGSGSVIGGLIGQDLANPGIASSYWATDSSGISNPSQGAGNVMNDPGITGMTTAQFQSGLPSGFGRAIWAESLGINGGLPYLTNLPPN